MASKQKEGIKEKFKTLFRLSKDDGASDSSGDGSAASFSSSQRSTTIFITPSILRSIGSESDVSSRLKALSELENLVRTKLLEDGAVEKLWVCIQDLVNSNDFNQRRVAMEFMVALCKGQATRMGLCRLIFFDRLKTVGLVDDGENGGKQLNLYVELLKSLCQDGQDISQFEEEIGALCLTFLHEHLRRKENASQFLRLLHNLIKSHAAYFDEAVMRDCVRYVCILACRTSDGTSNDEIISCLNVLDAILCYGCWPGGTLLVVATALCKLVNVRSLCEHCWMFMRNLLGSHYGHGTVYTMCSLMQAADTYPDDSVLRGAVFFVGASLWGAQQVDGLRHTPASVLSSMFRALDSNSAIVAYEVVLSIQRLVNKYGGDLQLLTWDLLLQTLERVFSIAGTNDPSSTSNTTKVSHDTLTGIEKLYAGHRFNGSPEQLFNLIEAVAKHRPNESILRLMAYRTQSLSPARGNWLSQLHALLDTYYNRENRVNVRAEAIRILRDLYDEHRHLHGDELIEVVVLPVFVEVDREKDYTIQAHVIKLLIDMAKTSTQNCYFELLSILERMINHRLETADLSTIEQSALHQHFQNVQLVLSGLIEIARAKWSCTPSAEATQVLDLLTSHILLQYSRNFVADLGSSARFVALKFLLSLGGEIGSHKLAYKDFDSGQLVSSAYIVCADPDEDASPPLSPAFAGTGRLTDFSAKEIMKAFASCIQKERYWSIVRLFLTELPVFLLSRRLALSDVDCITTICVSTINLYNDGNAAILITESADRLTMTDMSEQVYGLFTALISFRLYFGHHLRKQLASTIQSGIKDQHSGFAVVSTISSLLEMPDVMALDSKALVRRLSTLPSAPTIAIPVLELLSTLMRMHNLYADFSLDDFEHVIRTLTSYVNPFRFTDYIVAVAYQVLFRWFLRVPLALRPRMAQITLKRIGEIRTNHPVGEGNPGNRDDALMHKAFEDVREVCITFLAYYTFTDIPPSYDRSRIARELFGKNQSRHWAIGDRIFSITRSGDANGCQRCTRKKSENVQLEKLSRPVSSPDDFLSKRRRHASAIQQSVTSAATPSMNRVALDDTYVAARSPVLESIAPDFNSPVEINASKEVLSPCFCWCRDWIELTVRHAVGRQAWLIRVSNGRSTAAVDVDSLGILSCVGADSLDDEWIFETDGKLKNKEGEQVHLDQSAISLNGDGGAKGKIPEEKISSPAATDGKKAPERKFSLANLPPSSTFKPQADVPAAPAGASNTDFSGDVRAFLLQLFSANIGKDIHSGDVNILALLDGDALERAIKNLDRISSYEAHKIGVIYIGSRQTTEVEILGNQFGSPRYEKFISGLGRLISLKEADPSQTYLGGLDTNGRDGEFTYYWSDQTSQVIFHIATRMPNRENDPSFQQKKLHIGNDFVAIVFNEGGYDYKLSTISGQFARVAIIVQPLDDKILHIKLVAKNEISSWLTMKEATMSDEQAPLLCRQMAIRADASARIWEQHKSGEQVLSRLAERLRQIKSIKERFGGKPLTVESMFD